MNLVARLIAQQGPWPAGQSIGEMCYLRHVADVLLATGLHLYQAGVQVLSAHDAAQQGGLPAPARTQQPVSGQGDEPQHSNVPASSLARYQLMYSGVYRSRKL